MEDQLPGEVPVIGAVVGEPLDQVEHGEAVAVRRGARGGQEQLAVHEAKQGGDVLVAHGLAAEREHLVEQAQGVARAALRRARQPSQRLVRDLDPLPVGHLAQVRDELPRGDQAEVVLLAAREDRVRDLVVLGGGEDELHARGRLLEGLQEGVEGPRGQHVDLVDDPDLEAVPGRVVAGALAQLPDLLHAVVGGPVDLLHVEGGAGRDLRAGGALAARVGGGPVAARAVEGLGQDARGGGLADSARAGEEEGMADAARGQGVLEGARDRALPHDLVEGPGTPFACEDEVGHGGRGGPARREPRLSCGTLEGRLTVAPFRAWRGWASRVAQGRSPRPADPEDLDYYTCRQAVPGRGGHRPCSPSLSA